MEENAKERLMLPASQDTIVMSACERNDCNDEAMGGNFIKENNEIKTMV